MHFRVSLLAPSGSAARAFPPIPRRSTASRRPTAVPQGGTIRTPSTSTVPIPAPDLWGRATPLLGLAIWPVWNCVSCWRNGIGRCPTTRSRRCRRVRGLAGGDHEDGYIADRVSGDMRLTIDASRCAGHGRCFDLAPNLIDEDEQGYGQVRVSDVPPTLQAAARRASLWLALSRRSPWSRRDNKLCFAAAPRCRCATGARSARVVRDRREWADDAPACGRLPPTRCRSFRRVGCGYTTGLWSVGSCSGSWSRR